MHNFTDTYSPERVTLAEIAKTTRTLAFNDSEMRSILTHINKNRKKGLNTCFHPQMRGDIPEWLSEGFVGVCLMELNRSILYVKQDAGKGLFGRQKTVYASYVGSISENSLLPGVTFKNWLIAITGMNNIYRLEGLL